MSIQTRKRIGLALILLAPVVFVIGFLVYYMFGFGYRPLIAMLFIGSLWTSGIMFVIGFIILLSWYRSR